MTCDPENPPAGGETECTAEGLGPNTPFQWTAEFTDGSTQEGEGTADLAGTGTFTVPVPDTTPVGGYQVTVTGEDPDGNEYEETHRGLITPAGGEDEPSEEPGDDGDEGDDGDQQDDFSEEEGEAGFTSSDDTPQGGVATGAGGTAGPDPLIPILLVVGLAAVIGTVGYRRRLTHRS